MKLLDFKKALNQIEEINIYDVEGNIIPQHFHITEAGLTTKHFVDCVGKVREDAVVNFQLWVANDTDHRLKTSKLSGIIAKFEALFGNFKNVNQLEIEMEYQKETIGRYGVEFRNNEFYLTSKQTECLALDACGITKVKEKVNLSELKAVASECCAGDGCC